MDIDPSGDGAGGVDTGQSNAASGQCTIVHQKSIPKGVEGSKPWKLAILMPV